MKLRTVIRSVVMGAVATLFFMPRLAAAVDTYPGDTAIYETNNAEIEPNVLIILDTSQSMNDDVLPGDPYDPSMAYPVSNACESNSACNSNTVYKCTAFGLECGNWVSHVDNVSTVSTSCPNSSANPYDSLTTTGQWNSSNRALRTTGACTNGTGIYALGNWINWRQQTGPPQPKIDIAKEVVTNLISSTQGVRIGMMVFNNNQGGTFLTDGTSGYTTYVNDMDAFFSGSTTNRQALINTIPSITANSWTPLAESLFEAMRYYQGGQTAFNGSFTYTSPIQAACQKNYVVIVTDGMSTQDSDNVLRTICSNGDCDGDGFEPANDPDLSYPNQGSDYLDDVAKYMHDNDMSSTYTGVQNVITFTVGFGLGGADAGAVKLLKETAQNGGGVAYLSNNAEELSDSLTQILGQIFQANTSFVAPVVPVSPENRTYSGDYVYIGFFQPEPVAFWNGNLKKYGIYRGQIVGNQDATHICDPSTGNYCVPATDANGNFLASSYSFWSAHADGGDVQSGGVGGMLDVMTLSPTANYDLSNTNMRKIYTYFGTNTQLRDASNQFVTANPSVTPTALGLVAGDTTGRDKLVKFIHGQDAYSGSTTTRPWILGDVLHSGPAVVSYDNGLLGGHTASSVIYAGADDGMLHAFDDTTGKELWAYIPNDLLPTLQFLNGSTHHYYVDGSPKVYRLDNNNNGVIEATDSDGNHDKVIVIFGERRGGMLYHALDVTDPTDPKFYWSISPTQICIASPLGCTATTTYGEMGETWSTPSITKIAVSVSGTTVVKNVFFVGGGYDPANEDPDTPTADAQGRGVYAIEFDNVSATNGWGKVWGYTITDNASMTYALPSDMTLVDDNRDDYPDRLYIGDVGGRLWRFDLSSTDVTQWSGRILFSSNPGADTSSGRKIFYPPDLTRQLGTPGYYFLFYGTGDREHPEETTVVNRIYAVKDIDGSTASLTEADLVNVTADELQLDSTSTATINTILSNLDSMDGWYIKLDLDTGEKVVGGTVVFNKVVSVPTFSPHPELVVDPCVPNPGTGKVYELNYLTGEAVFNYDTTNDTTYTNNTNTRSKMTGGTDQILRRSDRVKTVGSGIPSQVVIVIPKDGTGTCDVFALIGVGGGAAGVEANCGGTSKWIYWLQML
jgi:type IV pilus assembly protein PilY1